MSKCTQLYTILEKCPPHVHPFRELFKVRYMLGIVHCTLIYMWIHSWMASYVSPKMIGHISKQMYNLFLSLVRRDLQVDSQSSPDFPLLLSELPFEGMHNIFEERGGSI
jgi:hypothetical protein